MIDERGPFSVEAMLTAMQRKEARRAMHDMRDCRRQPLQMHPFPVPNDEPEGYHSGYCVYGVYKEYSVEELIKLAQSTVTWQGSGRYCDQI